MSGAELGREIVLERSMPGDQILESENKGVSPIRIHSPDCEPGQSIVTSAESIGVEKHKKKKIRGRINFFME